MNILSIVKERQTDIKKQTYRYSSKRKPRYMPRTQFSVRLDGRNEIYYKGFFIYDIPSILHGMEIGITMTPLCFKYENKGTNKYNTYMSPPPKMLKINKNSKYQMDLL